MITDTKKTENTQTNLKKDDYKKASVFDKYITYKWLDYINQDESLTLKDLPDMREASDDFTEQLKHLKKNYELHN